ncbi:hypothetical protein TNCV_2409011 [Trichonephila clavipes]|nr:hypothetical protein TNCV_2409011 [Trichonephila clavipes]
MAEIANSVYGTGTVRAFYVQIWFRRFRSGIFDFKVAPHTGRSVLENVDKITEIIKVDRHKNVKSGKGPLTPAGLLKLVKRFEETGKLEDRARAGRPCLKEARAPCIAVEMEAIASEAASGTSSAREAARRLGLPP